MIGEEGCAGKVVFRGKRVEGRCHFRSRRQCVCSLIHSSLPPLPPPPLLTPLPTLLVSRPTSSNTAASVLYSGCKCRTKDTSPQHSEMWLWMCTLYLRARAASPVCVGGGGTALNVAVKWGSEQYEFPARSGAPAAFRVSGCALTGRPGRPPHPSCSRWYMSG